MFHPIYHEIVNSLRDYPTGGLMVLAEGISQTQVTSLLLLNFLDKSSNLIILVNFSITDLQTINTLLTKYVTDNQLDKQKYCCQVFSISKFTSPKRKQCYLSGGIVNISTQVLIQDILNGVLEPKLLTHLIIQRAEAVQFKHDFEAFLTVLIKLSNLRIFVLALSDRVVELQIKQNVPSILRYLFLPQVFPWPFKRIEIVKNLQECQFIWKEHSIPLRPTQLKIQDAVICLMTECVQELNRLSDNKTQLTVEQILHSSKYKIYSQLRRLRALIKNLDRNQLIIDLFRLKRLLFELLEQTDAGLMNQVQEIIYNSQIDSIILVPDANVERQVKAMVEGSKQRVFQIIPSEKTIKYRFPVIEKLPDIQFQDVELSHIFKLNNKANIKHGQMGQLLDQIFKQNMEDSEEKRVWILCKNIQAKKQVENYLNFRYLWGDETEVFQQMLILKVYLERVLAQKKQNYNRTLANPEGLTQKIQGKNIPQLRRQQLDLENLFLHLLQFEIVEFFKLYDKTKDQVFCANQIRAARENFQLLPAELFQLDYSNKITTIDESGEIVLYQEDKIKQGFIVSVNFLDGSSERIQYFDEYKPHYLIVMEPSNSILREVMLNKQDDFRELHLLFFENSIESQIFYREKLDEDDAFKQIIQQCSQMPQYNELPKDLIQTFQIQRFQSSRVGKGAEFFLQQAETQPYIIVDYREFRSEIPALLFYAGFRIVPMMLKTGDYVLSNKVVIERKCVETGDFGESLFGKRLDEQMKRLCDYEFPMLLIEYSDRIPFDLASLHRGSFVFQNETGEQKSNRNKTKALQKLFDLTSHYPKIQILWSKSPQNSIDIIKQIKQTLAQETPDIEKFRKQQQNEDEILDLQNTPNKDDLEKLIL